MTLKSRMFTGNQRLNLCQVNDASHVTPGDSGLHVKLVQHALVIIDDLVISDEELAAERYGSTTAAAVLQYKRKRSIINRAYQTVPDNIVGKMTITSLDNDMFALQKPPTLRTPKPCGRLTVPNPPASETQPPKGVTLAFAGFAQSSKQI